jgi:hypothetical protein
MTSSKNAPFARDLDLVRDILLWLKHGAKKSEQPSASDELRFNYHCQIMEQAGLIKASILTMPNDEGIDVPVRAHVSGLTWAGQDALAAFAKNAVWEHVKKQMGNHGLPMLWSVVVAFAKGVAAPNGLPLA